MKALVSGLKRCSQKLLLESVILVSIVYPAGCQLNHYYYYYFIIIIIIIIIIDFFEIIIIIIIIIQICSGRNYNIRKKGKSCTPGLELTAPIRLAD